MPRTPAALPCVLLLLAACGSAPVAAPAKGAEPATAGDAGASSRPPAAAEPKPGEAKAQDPAAKQRELELAGLELGSADLDAEAKRRAAEEAVKRTRRELELARATLATFDGLDRPVQIESAQIAHDRAAYAADEARDELGELEAMYQADEFAKATKELVLKRGRRRLEVAERELAVSKQRLVQLAEHTLQRQRIELEGKVMDAEAALGRAELDLRKAQIDADLALRRARVKVEDLEKELRERAAPKG